MRPFLFKLTIMIVGSLLALQTFADDSTQDATEKIPSRKRHSSVQSETKVDSRYDSTYKTDPTKSRLRLDQKMKVGDQRRRHGGGQDGDGGVVLQVGESVETFASAGIPVASRPKGLSLNEIPQLRELIQTINNATIFSKTTKAKLIGSLFPTDKRQYFRLKTDLMDKATYTRLTSIYKEISKLPSIKNKPFGLTDPKTGTTFLLDDFYALQKPTEQQAALYHEAYWITHPTATYLDVVHAEIHFQNFLENSSDQANVMNVLADIGTPAEILTAAFQFDIQNGSLRNLINQDEQGTYLELVDVIGLQQWPVLRLPGFGSENAFAIHPNLTVNNVIQASMTYPDSLFLKELVLVFSQSNEENTINLIFQGSSDNLCKYPQEDVVVSSMKIYINESTAAGVFTGSLTSSWRAAQHVQNCVSRIAFSPLGIDPEVSE